MRKRIITQVEQESELQNQKWLNIEELAEVEMTSEDAAHPIESALLPCDAPAGWRASEPGRQTIRLVFASPQRIERIWLKFVETDTERTQEFVLRWSADRGHSFQDIVRQQWNFSSQGATSETEDYRLDLMDVTVLELIIIPDISLGDAYSSLYRLRLA